MGTRAIFLLTLTLLVSACSSVQAQTTPLAALSGESNPPALAAAEQGALGRPAVVFFHAQWCQICRRVRPTLDELAEQYDNRIAIIRVDIDDSDASAAVERYRVNATPTFVLFSAEGNVLASVPGWPGREAMEMTLRQMLTEQ
jgi:thioredoxin 1